MHNYQPFSVIGFHSCDKEVGLRVLNGYDELLPSRNSWDWLGEGIYFWEQNPFRALEYAVESKAPYPGMCKKPGLHKRILLTTPIREIVTTQVYS